MVKNENAKNTWFLFEGNSRFFHSYLAHTPWPVTAFLIVRLTSSCPGMGVFYLLVFILASQNQLKRRTGIQLGQKSHIE